ncbi:MAG: TetR family transcriptional regulator [Rhizomicrobium sp.]
MADDTRTRLLVTAMMLFSEKGYEATSIADILRGAAPTAAASITSPDQAGPLGRGPQDVSRRHLPDAAAAAWEGVDDPIEKVFALLAHYRNHLVRTDCFYGCPIGNLALELHEPDPPVRELIAVNFDGWVSASNAALSRRGRACRPISTAARWRCSPSRRWRAA